MVTKRDIYIADNLKLPELGRGVLADQLKWLVLLRWFAILGIIVAGFVCSTYFPILTSPRPVYFCAVILFLCNLVFLFLARHSFIRQTIGRILFAMVQLEVDLIILTLLLHFAGGVTNPFVLFYVFHIIIATIILPRNLSFTIGISAIVMYGLMIICELHNLPWFPHYPLQFSSISPLAQNPVFSLGAFVAFSAMVVLTQYLTRTVIVRMTASELEAARNRDVLEAVVGTMSEGLVFVTNQGKISICNPSAERWFPGIKESIDNFPAVLSRQIKLFLTDDFVQHKPSEVITFSLDDAEKRYSGILKPASIPSSASAANGWDSW